MSRRKRGTFQSEETTLAVRLLPQPLTPMMSMPGGGVVSSGRVRIVAVFRDHPEVP
jgi:hypothetical protein